jgi:hypothetical protein
MADEQAATEHMEAEYEASAAAAIGSFLDEAGVPNDPDADVDDALSPEGVEDGEEPQAADTATDEPADPAGEPETAPDDTKTPTSGGEEQTQAAARAALDAMTVKLGGQATAHIARSMDAAGIVALAESMGITSEAPEPGDTEAAAGQPQAADTADTGGDKPSDPIAEAIAGLVATGMVADESEARAFVRLAEAIADQRTGQSGQAVQAIEGRIRQMGMVADQTTALAMRGLRSDLKADIPELADDKVWGQVQERARSLGEQLAAAAAQGRQIAREVSSSSCGTRRTSSWPRCGWRRRTRRGGCSGGGWPTARRRGRQRAGGRRARVPTTPGGRSWGRPWT